MTKTQGVLLNNKIIQDKRNIVSDMDREKVMLSIHNGKYYNLGEIGGKIWDCIEAPTTVTQLVDNLTLEYDVDRLVCEEQVVSFLNLLLAEGLIEIDEG